MEINEKQSPNSIALGMSAKDWVELLACDEAHKANKALHYLDGYQESEVEAMLDSPNRGRKQWRSRGIIPRFRNITKTIVEKSGLLFSNGSIKFEVMEYDADEANEVETDYLYEMLAKTEWEEVCINFDQVVRLLKSGMLLVQWDDEDQCLTFDILHRGNSSVITWGKKVYGLIYQTSGSSYRIFTDDLIVDLAETKRDGLHVVNSQPNTYGMIPAAMFYDTSTPRTGVWVDGGQDLINVNEMYNIHLTDSEFAMMWQKYGTTVTNCRLASDEGDNLEVVESYNGSAVKVSPGKISGPDRVVMLDTTGVSGTPFFEYKTIGVDIAPLDEAMSGWIKDFASDWSVRVRTSGEGTATSGFQLVVEELPNLELRKQRQKMFTAGFKRLFRVIKQVTNVAVGQTFSSDSELYVHFQEPKLPVDQKEQEELWSIRINEGRATVIDYFMETQGLSKEEAMAKWEGIQEFNAMEVEEPEEAVEPPETDDSMEDPEISSDVQENDINTSTED